MVPSGGLLRAKVAPAGAQMGSGNLINGGIVSEAGREERKGAGGKNKNRGGRR